MKLTGWGRYPVADSEITTPFSVNDILERINDESQPAFIPRGLGRSYGDSALAPHVISTLRLNHFLGFDKSSGLLTTSAGASFEDVLNAFVPKGWFPPVTPGTKFVTIGGAVASDIHGKNHHLEGSFTDHVTTFKVATPAEGIVECSRELNPELFHATCGGMGLTGVITEATFKLKPIQSAYVHQTIIKTHNLAELLELFEEHHDKPYTVAWVDCLSTGQSLGKSLLLLGQHIHTGKLAPGDGKRLTIPAGMPGILLNRYFIEAFNKLYYRQAREKPEQSLHYETFFYPLDKVHHWNRMYGKKGFVQYQFVIPKAAGLSGMTAILERIAESKRGSFLSVLKSFGAGNDNYLSFPMRGYTLALDFKLVPGVLKLLDELDRIVLDHGGRVYMTKDARMSPEVFARGYPDMDKFLRVRKRYGADERFHSLQSQRLGL